jgi:hypothetical protein
MASIKEAVQAAMASSAWQKGGGGNTKVWSFDNDRIHQRPETLAALKINSRNRFPLPPNSPDMHRVVERCIARLKQKWAAWFYANPAARDMKQHRAALLDIFATDKGVASPAVISAEVAKLPRLFPKILAREGDWAPRGEL